MPLSLSSVPLAAAPPPLCLPPNPCRSPDCLACLLTRSPDCLTFLYVRFPIALLPSLPVVLIALLPSLPVPPSLFPSLSPLPLLVRAAALLAFVLPSIALASSTGEAHFVAQLLNACGMRGTISISIS
ncbi:unnamed protein product, partial [Closterium sp. NIES-54]